MAEQVMPSSSSSNEPGLAQTTVEQVVRAHQSLGGKDKAIAELYEKTDKNLKDTETLQKDTEKLQKEMEGQKNLLLVGFYILLAMVGTLVVMVASEKVTADNELTHSVDLLQAQLNTQQSTAVKK